jgi:hypothetical protein
MHDWMRIQVCRSCLKTKVHRAFDRVKTPKSFHGEKATKLRDASISSSIDIIPRALIEKWKDNTYIKYGNSARTIEDWGEERGISLLGTAPEIDAYVVACYYNDRIDEGEGVAPKTADKELTVITHWYSRLVEHYPDAVKAMHPTECSMIKDLQKRAHMLYQFPPVKKVGLEIEDLKKIFGDGSLSGDWMWDHSRLACGVMFFFLARSIAAAHVVWRGDHRGPIATIDSDVSWNTDRVHGAYMRIDINRDKTIKAKEASNRFLPCDNGSGIEFSEYVRRYIRRYRVPDGTFLLAARKNDGSFSTTKFTNWSRVVGQVCDYLDIDREEYGTQSFRRGCAEWLNACGLDFDDVGLLGFWLSDVVRRYTGVQSAPRLSAWSKLH